jgi:hypothetical protein
MAQTVPMDSAYIREQAKKHEDQYWQHGTIAAVRNCPILAEAAVDSETGGDAAADESGKSMAHRMALQQAGNPAPPARTQCGNIHLRPELAPQFWATMGALKVASESLFIANANANAKFDEQMAALQVTSESLVTANANASARLNAQMAATAEAVAASSALQPAMAACAVYKAAAETYDAVAEAYKAATELTANATAVSKVAAEMAASVSAVNKAALTIVHALTAAIAIAQEGDGRARIAFGAMSTLPEQAGGGSGGIPPTDEAQQRAWKSAGADDRFRFAPQKLQLAWTMHRRMHRALGRTYPSNDTGPCK